MEWFIALLATILAGVIAYALWPVPASYWRHQLGQALAAPADAESRPFTRVALGTLAPLVNITPVGWKRIIETQLYWAQLGGRWADWSPVEIVALHLVAVGVALSLALLTGTDVVLATLAVIVAPLLFNLFALRAPARRARRQLAAELPEFVSLLAAEVGADTTLSEAILRLSGGAGLCARWFRHTTTLNGLGGLFTDGARIGALRAEAIRSGEADLIGLATALDSAKRRGTGVRELLSHIAASTASRYIGEANLRAERVGSEIILPMIVFFFFPYIVVVLMVMAAPLLGGGLF